MVDVVNQILTRTRNAYVYSLLEEEEVLPPDQRKYLWHVLPSQEITAAAKPIKRPVVLQAPVGSMHGLHVSVLQRPTSFEIRLKIRPDYMMFDRARATYAGGGGVVHDGPRTCRAA